MKDHDESLGWNENPGGKQVFDERMLLNCDKLYSE